MDARPDPELPDDELLDDRYRLTEQIGSGGMGTVYRAHDTRLDRTVAVKLLHRGRDVDDVTRARCRPRPASPARCSIPGSSRSTTTARRPGRTARRRTSSCSTSRARPSRRC